MEYARYLSVRIKMPKVEVSRGGYIWHSSMGTKSWSSYTLLSHRRSHTNWFSHIEGLDQRGDVLYIVY